VSQFKVIKGGKEPERPSGSGSAGGKKSTQKSASRTSTRSATSGTTRGATSGTTRGATRSTQWGVPQESDLDSRQGTQLNAPFFDDPFEELDALGAAVDAGADAAEANAVAKARGSKSDSHSSDLDFEGINAPGLRWAWADVDLDAISFNTKSIRKHIGSDVHIMAVVKAQGYGHGAVATARAALSSGASYLGVATVQEGVELREAGIDAPTLVLVEPPHESIPLILDYDLITTVQTTEFALALGEAADAQDTAALYHLKIDTGMNRHGVHYSDAGDFLRTVDFHRGLELHGVFTHFATSDAHDTLDVRRQLEYFNQALENIRYMGISPGIVHAANSAALIRFKETHFDMVRPGIALYGLHTSEITNDLIALKPAMSVRARITQLKQVPVGEGVSYGFTYRSPGNVLVGTIPLGYADGLSRVLSNRMDVLVDGRAYPQVGTICMDACMFEIDLRSTPLKPRQDIIIGDEVVIIGRSGALEITLDDMARALGTINYDLACRFGMRLGRRYLGGD